MITHEKSYVGFDLSFDKNLEMNEINKFLNDFSELISTYDTFKSEFGQHVNYETYMRFFGKKDKDTSIRNIEHLDFYEPELSDGYSNNVNIYSVGFISYQEIMNDDLRLISDDVIKPFLTCFCKERNVNVRIIGASLNKEFKEKTKFKIYNVKLKK
jgi:hypothetical protein